jgi:thiamine pyrophosphate-dependent acetolactate synthase large subunit-like protein
LILFVGILALIGSALGGIFTASVYRYATKGDGGSMFNNQVLATAFRQKR